MYSCMLKNKEGFVNVYNLLVDLCPSSTAVTL